MNAYDILHMVLEKTELPVKDYEYRGKKDTYIVINEETEKLDKYADDRPQLNVIWWQVHFFSPEQSEFRLKKEYIRKLLVCAGFHIENVMTMYEQETQTMHIVFSCRIEERGDI